MRCTATLSLLIIALVIIIMDTQYGLGIVAFLSDYFVVLLVLAVIFGAIGVRGIRV